MRQEFFGEAIIEGEATGEYMGAAKAFYDVTLCHDEAPCTLFEGCGQQHADLTPVAVRLCSGL